ncbi:hypothetical protein Ciccas_000841 [Cichlidogyrus casuarinus]|uniref:Uncharacterized protein n=1 Tax=Cichlidogyrus casuarinus TaxID=1844966 RepID=A0ABD2QP03_9PLAT
MQTLSYCLATVFLLLSLTNGQNPESTQDLHNMLDTFDDTNAPTTTKAITTSQEPTTLGEESTIPNDELTTISQGLTAASTTQQQESTMIPRIRRELNTTVEKHDPNGANVDDVSTPDSTTTSPKPAQGNTANGRLTVVSNILFMIPFLWLID